MRMTLSRRLRFACLMFVLVCTVVCDQTAKHIARAGLSQAGSVSLLGGLAELRLAENPGSFLSLGALLPEPARSAVFTFGVGIGLAALLAYLTCLTQLSVAHFIGLALVLAGGLSNLLDRILHDGLVTDFVIIHIGPFHTGVFNAADVLIMVGIGVIIWSLCKKNRPTSRTNPTPP